MPITHNIVTMSNDTGYYTGLPYNFYMDKGQEVPGINATVYQQAQDGFWFMKSVLKTAGWSVVAWGSGALGQPQTTGLYSDPFSSSLSMCSDHGWYILKQPNSSRSFAIQKAGPASASNEGSLTNYHNGSYRIKYSPSGFAITGTLTSKVMPGPITGSDELVIHGAGTDALPTYTKLMPAIADSSNGGTAIFHCIAQTTAPYGFMLLGQYGAPVVTVFGIDPVITPNATDTEPYVIFCEYNANFPLTNAGVATFMNAFTKWTYNRRGFADQVSGAIAAGLSYFDYNQSMSVSSFTSGRHPGKKATFMPMTYVTSQSNLATSSYKGVSTMFKIAPMTGTPAVTLQSTFSVFSLYDAAQIATGLVIPWFGVRYEAY